MTDAPMEQGTMARPDGARIHVERFGRGPVAALFLHGGPGSGLGEWHRSYFDPALHTAFAMDQRGCGRSTPSVADEPAALRAWTTQSLIEDIEALREREAIDRWLVVGLSWGATLALAYAEAHPARVCGLALGAVTTTSRSEVDWITQDLRRLFPAQWSRLADAARARPGERLIDALHRGITSEDAAERDRIAVAWGEWEDTHPSLDPRFAPDPRWQDPRKRLELAMLVIHCWSHDAFLGEAGILEAAGRLAGIPGVMVHGRLDVSASISVPWELQRRWPGAEIIEIEDEGHFGPRIAAAVRDAAARLARRD